MQLETINLMRDRLAKLEAAHKATIALKASLTALGKLEYCDMLDELMPGLGAEMTPLHEEVLRRKKTFKQYSMVYSWRIITEIPTALNAAKNQLKAGCDEVERKRKKMRDAGVPNDELQRIVPDYNRQADLDQIASLEEETLQWKRFVETCLVEDLPPKIDEFVKTMPYVIRKAA